MTDGLQKEIEDIYEIVKIHKESLHRIHENHKLIIAGVKHLADAIEELSYIVLGDGGHKHEQ